MSGERTADGTERYAHLPTVGDEWTADSWDNVFVGPYNATDPTWHSATPPPKTVVEPIAPADVAEVTHISVEAFQEYADQDIRAVMRLHDGRWACVESWSDSSGYGCQDSTMWHVGGSLQDVVRWGLEDEGRRRLDLTDLVGGTA